MMLWLQRTAFTAMAAVGFTTQATTSPLRVTVEAPVDVREKEAGVVLITVINQSPRPILILKADSALLSDGEHLLNDVMTVRTVDGRAVTYRGRSARPAFGDREAYWTMAPGDTKTSRVNLPANYAVEGGAYNVSYTQRYLEEGDFSPEGATAREAPSNVITIYLNADLIQHDRVVGASSTTGVPRSSGPDDTCQDTAGHPDRETLMNARSHASTWAFFGYDDVGDLYGTTRTPVAPGKMVWRAIIQADADYTSWFGAPQDTSPSFAFPPSRADVWDAGDFLPLHVTKAIWARVNARDSYSCGCSAAYNESHTAAWTEPTVTHICDWFWQLPFSDYGVDNQVLTIVHENGHHADSFGPYVGDYAVAYGRAGAKAFAITDREKALINADNYAYYVEARRKRHDVARSSNLMSVLGFNSSGASRGLAEERPPPMIAR